MATETTSPPMQRAAQESIVPGSPRSHVFVTNSQEMPAESDFSSLVCNPEPCQTLATEPSHADNLRTELCRLNRKLSSARRWLIAICALVMVWIFSFAQAILIPMTLSIVLYLLLRPAVRALHRRRIPEPAAAAVCLFLVAGALVMGIMPLVGPAQHWLENLPNHLQSADRKLQVIRQRIGQFSALRSRIAQLTASHEEERPVPVAVQQPELTSETVFLSTTGNTLGMFVVIFVLTFFLLISGDQLINRVLSILPTFHEKRQTVELILDVQRGISSYLLTITMINIGLGIAIACALWLLGVPNPAMWGLLTTVFNYVPFVGQGVAGLLIGLVALLTFDSVAYALLVPTVFYSIAAVEGNLITPALVGRHLSLNPILVLMALLFWGWLWGIAGAALAVPILAMAKISCDRFECTRSIGTLLGG